MEEHNEVFEGGFGTQVSRDYGNECNIDTVVKILGFFFLNVVDLL